MRSLKNVYFCLILLFYCLCLCRGYYLEITNPQQSEDTCSNECVKKVALSSNNVGIGRSCARGCRFFEIAHLIYLGNTTLHGCFSYCEESYKESEIDLISCKTGCSTSKPRLPIDVPLIAEISWSFFIESGDISEQDEVALEPSYRDQFTNFEDFKIPEMKFRTLPVKHEGSRGWRGFPHCLIASLLLLLVILVLLLGLLIEESSLTITNEESSPETAPPLPEKFPIV